MQHGNLQRIEKWRYKNAWCVLSRNWKVIKFCFQNKSSYRTLHKRNKSISGWKKRFGACLWVCSIGFLDLSLVWTSNTSIREVLEGKNYGRVCAAPGSDHWQERLPGKGIWKDCPNDLVTAQGNFFLQQNGVKMGHPNLQDLGRKETSSYCSVL